MTSFATTTSQYLTPEYLRALPEQYGSPVWVYDSAVIIERIKQLQVFDTVRFAQKACSNIHILCLMKQQGVKVDSVSLGEIERALVAGFQPGRENSEIVFTADVLDRATLAKVTGVRYPCECWLD